MKSHSLWTVRLTAHLSGCRPTATTAFRSPRPRLARPVLGSPLASERPLSSVRTAEPDPFLPLVAATNRSLFCDPLQTNAEINCGAVGRPDMTGNNMWSNVASQLFVVIRSSKRQVINGSSSSSFQRVAGLPIRRPSGDACADDGKSQAHQNE